MFLDYLALAMLLMGLTLVFYGFIYVHDLPHKIAEKREHPHEEAIHVGCWLSLFTLHALWPFIYLWAVAHKPQPHGASESDQTRKFAEMEERLRKLEVTK